MTFPFAARTNAPNTRAASMEPLEVLLSTHNPQVDKLLGGGFPCKGFVELLTTGERRGETSLLIHALAHVKRVVWTSRRKASRHMPPLSRRLALIFPDSFS